MNISFDAKRAFHNNRGLGNYSRNVIRLLSSYYPENNYYLFNPTSKKNIPFDRAKNVHEIVPTKLMDTLFPSYWRTKNCLSQVKELNTTIYHGLSQELPIGIEKTGVKSVVTMHDAIFMRYPELYDSFYRKIFIKKNQYSCHIADKIIAISEQTKQDFIDYFHVPQEKITVVYQGCNNIFRNNISESQKTSVKEKYQLPTDYILNVGAIEKRKNVATIIEALHRGKIDIPMVVIGNKTAYLKEVKELINRYQLEKQVLFLHQVETTDLPAIYTMAQLFIYPSIFEGFGIPILEALCTGTPVITSKGSCFEETGGAYSSYVDYNNADEMGEQIMSILSDTTKKETMQTKGLEHAEKFKDEYVVQNLMNVYLSIL